MQHISATGRYQCNPRPLETACLELQAPASARGPMAPGSCATAPMVIDIGAEVDAALAAPVFRCRRGVIPHGSSFNVT